MNEVTGPVRIRAARELLVEEPAEIVALAGHMRCSTCGALVPSKGAAQHRAFHDALAVVAGRVFGPETRP